MWNYSQPNQPPFSALPDMYPTGFPSYPTAMWPNFVANETEPPPTGNLQSSEFPPR
jgi:hypothetical protein